MPARYLILTLLFIAAGSAASPVSGGYREAVFSVSDVDAYTSFFETVAGWDVLHRGRVDPVLLSAWGLPDGAGAQHVVLGNPGTTRGYVRLVEFENVEQRVIRSNAQTWDTGGWFDVNSRVLSMAETFAAITARGWQAYSDPVEFAFGPFVVKEWLARGPDGIVIAVIERVAPPLEGWPQLRRMSRLFNATQIVADIDDARGFYLNTLGFLTYLDHSGPSESPGPNVLGLPHNLAATVPRHVSIVHPHGSNEGSVELLQFDGADGADFSMHAVPPNLGILMLRFPVSDADALHARLREHGVEPEFRHVSVDLPPYGRQRVTAVRGPGGAWIEFLSDAEPSDEQRQGGRR
ncbi:MAG: VOC family protein [Woeseiaceae bacterium]|nr:VOC family protein [Woeseiaceae bacterium]